MENPSYCTIKGGAASAASKPAVSAQKSVDEIAKEVIQGKWGNGSERKKRSCWIQLCDCTGRC